MEEGGLTLFDWIVITVVGLSGLLALFRGFIREVLSLMTWLIAAFVTIHYYDNVKAALSPFITHKLALTGLSTVGLFVLLLVVLSILNAFIMRFLQAGGDISILDSILGMCFGVVRGLFILSLAYVMFAVVMPKEDFPDMVKDARTLPLVEYSAGVLQSLAPGYMKELGRASEEARKEGERMAHEKAREELERSRQAPAGTGASEERSMQLQQLLDRLQPEGNGSATQAPEENR